MPRPQCERPDDDVNVRFKPHVFEAAAAFAWSHDYQPAAAAVESSLDARRFFAARGLREAGTFTGLHGVDHVFVDETVPAFTGW